MPRESLIIRRVRDSDVKVEKVGCEVIDHVRSQGPGLHDLECLQCPGVTSSHRRQTIRTYRATKIDLVSALSWRALL